MGLKNSPETFKQTMNSLFVGILDKGLVVFVDDILMYSTTVGEHFNLLEKVFAHLNKYEF